ncbi:sel1 repeat family protein [Xenophilus sp. Marseille-Q4582]|uniref:sel1 repeat family protein n=1 Tax=Xenophilus sp. Marseille-Q4582 TaxID=2866600 RepID=UPI001CE462F1|nr:sel1 repeat family protein [Xenophilus sp. Marseille-Q4582]
MPLSSASFRPSAAAGLLFTGLAALTAAAGPVHGIDPALPLTREQAFSLALEADTQRDRAAVLHWLRRAARADLLPAQEMLGVVLMQGLLPAGAEGARARCEARDWFHRAAQQGSAIGRMHRDLINRALAGQVCG